LASLLALTVLEIGGATGGGETGATISGVEAEGLFVPAEAEEELLVLWAKDAGATQLKKRIEQQSSAVERCGFPKKKTRAHNLAVVSANTSFFSCRKIRVSASIGRENARLA